MAAANKVFKEIEQLAVRIHNESHISQLERLFNHEHYNVRLNAATFSLLKNEQKALEALDALFKESDPQYSRDAMRTIMAWEQGKTRSYFEALFAEP